MNVTVEYAAQLRVATQVDRETVEIGAEGASLRELLVTLAERHGEPLRALILTAEGRMNPWIFADQSGVMLRDDDAPLNEGDVIRLLSPISGG